MNKKDIENLAEAAKITLTEIEKESLLKDLEGILNYVKQIKELDVPDISIDYLNKNRWREDIPCTDESYFSRELIISQFPDSQDGFLKVKKIL